MEEACHELDLKVASMTGSLASCGGGSFEEYSSALHKMFALKEESEKQ